MFADDETRPALAWLPPDLLATVDRIRAGISKFSIEGKIGLFGLSLFVMMALFAPVIGGHPPDAISGYARERP